MFQPSPLLWLGVVLVVSACQMVAHLLPRAACRLEDSWLKLGVKLLAQSLKILGLTTAPRDLLSQ